MYCHRHPSLSFLIKYWLTILLTWLVLPTSPWSVRPQPHYLGVQFPNSESFPRSLDGSLRSSCLGSATGSKSAHRSSELKIWRVFFFAILEKELGMAEGREVPGTTGDSTVVNLACLGLGHVHPYPVGKGCRHWPHHVFFVRYRTRGSWILWFHRFETGISDTSLMFSFRLVELAYKCFLQPRRVPWNWDNWSVRGALTRVRLPWISIATL